MVMATYGEGDPTDNAVEFYKWIHEDGREEGCLKGMSFAVMGLGNRCGGEMLSEAHSKWDESIHVLCSAINPHLASMPL